MSRHGRLRRFRHAVFGGVTPTRLRLPGMVLVAALVGGLSPMFHGAAAAADELILIGDAADYLTCGLDAAVQTDIALSGWTDQAGQSPEIEVRLLRVGDRKVVDSVTVHARIDAQGRSAPVAVRLGHGGQSGRYVIQAMPHESSLKYLPKLFRRESRSVAEKVLFVGPVPTGVATEGRRWQTVDSFTATSSPATLSRLASQTRVDKLASWSPIPVVTANPLHSLTCEPIHQSSVAILPPTQSITFRLRRPIHWVPSLNRVSQVPFRLQFELAADSEQSMLVHGEQSDLVGPSPAVLIHQLPRPSLDVPGDDDFRIHHVAILPVDQSLQVTLTNTSASRPVKIRSIALQSRDDATGSAVAAGQPPLNLDAASQEPAGPAPDAAAQAADMATLEAAATTTPAAAGSRSVLLRLTSPAWFSPTAWDDADLGMWSEATRRVLVTDAWVNRVHGLLIEASAGGVIVPLSVSGSDDAMTRQRLFLNLLRSRLVQTRHVCIPQWNLADEAFTADVIGKVVGPVDRATTPAVLAVIDADALQAMRSTAATVVPASHQEVRPPSDRRALPRPGVMHVSTSQDDTLATLESTLRTISAAAGDAEVWLVPERTAKITPSQRASLARWSASIGDVTVRMLDVKRRGGGIDGPLSHRYLQSFEADDLAAVPAHDTAEPQSSATIGRSAWAGVVIGTPDGDRESIVGEDDVMLRDVDHAMGGQLPDRLIVEIDPRAAGVSPAIRDRVIRYRQLPETSPRAVPPDEAGPSTIRLHWLRRDRGGVLVAHNDAPWRQRIVVPLGVDAKLDPLTTLDAGGPGIAATGSIVSLDQDRHRLEITLDCGAWVAVPIRNEAGPVHWTAGGAIADETLKSIQWSVTQVVERLGHLQPASIDAGPQSMTRLSNGGFERSGEVGLAGWMHTQFPADAVVVDDQTQSEGGRSIRLTNAAGAANRTWIISEPITPPASGRMAVSLTARAKTRPGLSVAKLCVAIETTHRGQPKRQFAEVEFPANSKWQSRQTVLEIGDLDRAGQPVRVAIDSMTIGDVWIDDVRLHCEFPLEYERRELQGQAYLAVQGLQQRDLHPAAVLLSNPWASYLLRGRESWSDTPAAPDAAPPDLSPPNSNP